jgi:hypothetical protein
MQSHGDATNPVRQERKPEHLEVIRALTDLAYEFEPQPDIGFATRTRGYAVDSVVEVTEGSPATVSLLVSTSSQRGTVASSRLAIVAVASATGVDFLGWLADQMKSRGRERPWVASRRFRRRRVRAELLTTDAMLLTVEGAS